MGGQTFIYEVQDNGRLPDAARIEIANFIARFPTKMLRIEFTLYRPRRTDNQNKYYWGVVLPVVTRMLRDFGNEVNEFDAHEYLKHNVMKLGRMMIGPDGPEFILGSTSDIPREEWSSKMDMVRGWAAQHGTQIPLPGENLEKVYE